MRRIILDKSRSGQKVTWSIRQTESKMPIDTAILWVRIMASGQYPINALTVKWVSKWCQTVASISLDDYKHTFPSIHIQLHNQLSCISTETQSISTLSNYYNLLSINDYSISYSVHCYLPFIFSSIL